MKFSEVIEQARDLLQRTGKITYRVLKREFALDDESLEDLKEQFIDAEEVAVDKDGKMLVWTGEKEHAPDSSTTDASPRTPDSRPIRYTPQHLAERILAEHAAMELRGAAEGERKTITALFADLKGSTALIEGLDPEEARAIIDPALQLMMDAVHRYDGYVAQALGDGILALFGAPLAHEDHPQRALYAALRMQEEMRGYSDQVRLKHGVPLYMRVGVNTGEVVVRSIRKDDLHTDYVPVGHSTNLAARMEQMATPGSIVISEYTRKLTEGYFELKALGAAAIKGVEEPLSVYEVLGAGPLRTRFQVTARRGLTRFVGRHRELDQMEQALEQAKEGHGQIVGVMGEPGLGKSRLFYEFVGAVREPPLLSQSGCLVLEAFSVSHGKASPYLPLIELLKTYFQLEPTDDERTRRQKVIGQVLELDRSLEDTLPYLFSLLGIEDQTSNLLQMDAHIRRQRMFEALKKLFLRESLNQVLIVIFEDLHWIDTETQGFLDMLSVSVASAKLLLLVNYRPECRHEWGHKTYYTQLRLAPLGKAEAEELLSFLLGRDTSLNRLKALILERTEGAPFFMEEVVQTLAEEAVLVGERGNYLLEQALPELHISPTVQGVLAARIDRLTTEEKELLQQLAVIGRQFPVSLVKQVISQPEDEIYRLLSSLQAREFLYEQPAFPEVEYIFKHALTHEVAYGTLLQDRRKALHERTAQAIERLYDSSLEDHYSELAQHYTEAGRAEQAVAYWQKAGEQALDRSAYMEAVAHLTRGLDVLKTLPNSLERSQFELQLQIPLGAAFVATRGPAAAEVGEVYRKAQELCREVGKTDQLFPILRGLWGFSLIRAELQTAQELGEQCLQLAQQLQDPVLRVEAHYALGDTLWCLGKFKPSRDILEEGITYYDLSQHRLHISQYSMDAGVACLSHAALVRWHLGYPDKARQQMTKAVSLAQQISQMQSTAFALVFAATLQQFCRDGSAVQEQTRLATVLVSEQGLPFWGGWASILEGWAKVVQGEREEGIIQIQQSIVSFQATKAAWGYPYWLGLLAEAYAAIGQIEEGLNSLSEAMLVVKRTEERFYEAELYRLKGKLLLQSQVQGSSSTIETQAEECFQKALDVARRQEAKSWELRAATSLARLWQQQGKQTEARALLAPVYNWFTEGFDTADLKDAKALLVELG